MFLSESSHCGLVVVVELVSYSEKRRLTIGDISKSQHLPETILDPVIEKLCSAGLLYSESGDGQLYFFVQKNSNLISVWDIIQVFEPDFFAGVFIDEQSGKCLHQGYLSTIINMEREQVKRYLMTRFKKMTVCHLCDSVKENNMSYLWQLEN